MTSNTTIWENEYNIERAIHIKALESDFIIFSRVEITSQSPENPNIKRGLYFSKVDFNLLENDPNLKLTDLIKSNTKKIIEFDNKTKLMRNWDIRGNKMILAIAFSLDTSDLGDNSPTYTTKLMALVKNSEFFNVCDEFDHNDPIHSISVIIPFEDKERAHAVYGSNGLLYSKH